MNKLHSITIGRATYIEGKLCQKPISFNNTEDAIVERLEIDRASQIVSVVFEDGDTILTHLSAAIIHYKRVVAVYVEPLELKPIEIEPKPIEAKPKVAKRRRKIAKKTK